MATTSNMNVTETDAMEVDMPTTEISSTPTSIDAVLSVGATTTASAATAAVAQTVTSTAGAVVAAAAAAAMDSSGSAGGPPASATSGGSGGQMGSNPTASLEGAAAFESPHSSQLHSNTEGPTSFNLNNNNINNNNNGPSADSNNNNNSASTSNEAPKFQAAPAWDAHLDNPAGVDPAAIKMQQALRRAGLGLVSDRVQRFSESVELASLGCFCAVANAMQLLGLKNNTYPFDWVRSSLDGIMHCIDAEFEDFLTYSTYNVQNGYVVFGGTRWGGSFWHHNLEVPLTKSDMSRRVERFFGKGSVSPKMPRLFARVVNSSREVEAAKRLRRTLQDALPECEEIFLLLIVDLQQASGPIYVSELGTNTLLYTISEQDTTAALTQGQQSFQLCSETYAKAIAFAVRYWAGDAIWEQAQQFSTLREASRSLVQFDGGDAGRDLFTPKKFYGQVLNDESDMTSLLASLRSQVFLLPEGVNAALPFFVECFGKRLSVALPPNALAGQVLNIWISNGILTASVGVMVQGQMNYLGPASVQELDS